MRSPDGQRYLADAWLHSTSRDIWTVPASPFFPSSSIVILYWFKRSPGANTNSKVEVQSQVAGLLAVLLGSPPSPPDLTGVLRQSAKVLQTSTSQASQRDIHLPIARRAVNEQVYMAHAESCRVQERVFALEAVDVT